MRILSDDTKLNEWVIKYHIYNQKEKNKGIEFRPIADFLKKEDQLELLAVIKIIWFDIIKIRKMILRHTDELLIIYNFRNAKKKFKGDTTSLSLFFKVSNYEAHISYCLANAQSCKEYMRLFDLLFEAESVYEELKPYIPKYERIFNAKKWH